MPMENKNDIELIRAQLGDKFDIIYDSLKSIWETICNIVNKAFDVFSYTWDSILKSYPNKRVVHLAFYHKKARVRKKNRNRIIKDIMNQYKRGD